MPSGESRKILIIAAEASSCLYARRLLQHWKKHNISVEAFGVGDEAMASEGFECLARAEDMAVVGFAEVIAHWDVIKQAAGKLLEAAAKRRPQVVLLLDYPGFNLRFAKKMKAMGIPVVYYISPQIWAWKKGRIKQIQKFVDKMLVIYPFEKTFYDDNGVHVEFVGHPLLDELDTRHFNTKSRDSHRAKFGVTPDDVLLALMPGSRRSEMKYNLQAQLEAARVLQKKHPWVKVAMFVAPSFTTEQVQEWLSGLDFPLMLIKDEPFSMIDLADVVLCASGTATLMVGLLEKPMVIMYKVNRLTATIAKWFIEARKNFGLINLVLGEHAVPELFQEKADVPHLVDALEPMLINPEKRRQIQERLRPAKTRLGSAGATSRVAAALESYWSK
jgi:lipid-A-disaccharide synthase